jgi:trans-aconitate 2-methyltransferase
LLLDWVGQLREGGLLAAQMPRRHASPVSLIQREISQEKRWNSKLGHLVSFSVSSPEHYFDLLCKQCKYLDIWETEYLHLLRGTNPVLEWMLGSALVPFLRALTGAEQA